MENETPDKKSEQPKAEEEQPQEQPKEEAPAEEPSQDLYKEELEKLRQENAEKEEKIKRLNQQNAEKRVKSKREDDGEEPEEEPKEDVRSVIREELVAQKREDYVDSQAGSPSRAELIKFHMDNSIQSTGDITEDYRRASLLADAGKIEARDQEIQEQEKAKQNRSQPSGFSKPAQKAQEPSLSEEDRKMLKGYVFDADQGVYKPKEGGKFGLKVQEGELVQVNL